MRIDDPDNGFVVRDSSVGSDRLAIDTSGNVGIGTTSPLERLHVAGNLYMRRDTGGAHATITSSADVVLTLAADHNNSGEFDQPELRFTQDGGLEEVHMGYFEGTNDFAIRRLDPDDSVRNSIVISDELVSIQKSLEIRGGADIVEHFESSCGEPEPGTVVVIDPDHPGQLACSFERYDTKVAGVVSGAGGVNPGICLGQDGVLDGDLPVTMTGRVYVKGSAENGAIRPGDRLTTATLAGHAMKVTDSARADGAVIGKAMSALDEGTGLVLVLVNLQ
jgi:hypothetical protein